MRRFSPVIGITSATVPMAARSQEDSHTLQALSEPATAHGQLEGHSHAGQPLEGIGTAGLVGVYHRHGIRQEYPCRCGGR